MHVAVAIDDTGLRSSVVRTLTAAGHTAVVYPVGRQALGSALRRDAGILDAAVIGLRALGDNGFRLLRLIRQVAPPVAVVVLLGPGRERVWPQLFRAGAFEAVAWAGAPETILRAIDRVQAYRERTFGRDRRAGWRRAVSHAMGGQAPDVGAA